MKVSAYFIILFFGICIYSNESKADRDGVDLLLKARGLQALERIEALGKKNGNSQGKNLTPQEVCNWSLEGMFLPFAHPDLIKIVKKDVPQKLSKEAQSFALLIKQDEISFQIWYTYLKKTDSKPFANEIPLLGKGWSIIASANLPGYISIKSPKCFYNINLTNPLDVTVEAN